MLKRLFLISAAVVCFCSHSLAQPSNFALPPEPRDMSQVDIYLGTRDIGHEIYSKYGHTIVRIVDRTGGTDIGYNWGTFNFNAPGFIPNFLRGILIYYMSFGPWWDEVDISKYEQQTMWMERVNLTNAQKQRLIDRIMWQAKPENINYPYLFFYDNCSTRVRDLFDLAVNGKIKARTQSQMPGKTYRDRVMEHNASAPFFAMGQDIILNSEPDKQMTEWEDMFVPGRMRDYLLKMPAFDDAGNEIPGQTFLSDTKTLTQFPRPEVPTVNGYMLIWLLAGLPTFAGIIIARRASFKSIGARLVGLGNIVLGGLWGFIGIFLSASWAFGSHTVLPHNANLWMIWPTDIIYLFAGIYMIFTGKWLTTDRGPGKLLKKVTLAHMAGIAILIVVTVFNIIDQNTSRIVSWFVPLTFFVFWSSTLPIKGITAK